jgi:hypothetical protein
MSATLEATTLDAVVEQATPEQRRYLLRKLIAKDAAEMHLWGQAITNEAGDTIGYFIPRFVSTATEPPKLSPEERAELDRRLATPNQTISHDEMLKRLGLADVHPRKR